MPPAPELASEPEQVLALGPEQAQPQIAGPDFDAAPRHSDLKQQVAPPEPGAPGLYRLALESLAQVPCKVQAPWPAQAASHSLAPRLGRARDRLQRFGFASEVCRLKLLPAEFEQTFGLSVLRGVRVRGPAADRQKCAGQARDAIDRVTPQPAVGWRVRAADSASQHGARDPFARSLTCPKWHRDVTPLRRVCVSIRSVARYGTLLA